MIVEGHGHKVEIPDSAVQKHLRSFRAVYPNADTELLMAMVKRQLFPVYFQISANAEYDRQKRDEEARKAARQAKIADLRRRLIQELRPTARKEELQARRQRFNRAVDTRLAVLVDRTLKTILEQEDAESGDGPGNSEHGAVTEVWS